MSELILKEDALNCFHDWIDRYGCEHTADEDTTYQLIEALDAVRCCDEDCISRRVVIEAIDDIESEVADGFGFQYEKWRKYFCELPAVQPDHNADVSKKVDVDDCISRRAAKEKLKQNFTYMRAFGVDRCLEIIDEIPAVKSEPKWVPCSERLPEKAGEYLITKIRIGWNGQRYTEIAVDYFYGDYGKEYGMVWKISKKVVAWMPLPEPPYKEEQG